jgi:hypothetical protein
MTSNLPIVVDLGKKSKKRIKEMKGGRGAAYHEVLDTLDQLKATLGDDSSGKKFVPVVVVYKRSRGGRRTALPLAFPF